MKFLFYVKFSLTCPQNLKNKSALSGQRFIFISFISLKFSFECLGKIKTGHGEVRSGHGTVIQTGDALHIFN